jgi:biopolymer transport protein ExbD
MGVKKKKRRATKQATLNITSMMDMFTIILVFLLFSFKAQDEAFSLAKGIKLPSSTSQLDLQDALNIHMASDGLVVQEALVIPLNDGKLPEGLQMEGAKIVKLFEVIKVEGEKRRLRKERGGDKLSDEDKSIVIFQADRRVRFEDIDKVMKTAAMAGFPNFRFAVMKK